MASCVLEKNRKAKTEALRIRAILKLLSKDKRKIALERLRSLAHLQEFEL